MILILGGNRKESEKLKKFLGENRRFKWRRISAHRPLSREQSCISADCRLDRSDSNTIAIRRKQMKQHNY